MSAMETHTNGTIRRERIWVSPHREQAIRRRLYVMGPFEAIREEAILLKNKEKTLYC